jgi:putative SOS response-associated peptidase YedK
MHIGMRGGAPFAFAGIAERWLGPDGEPLDTCEILTTDANTLLRDVHERMPVIVPASEYARWLDPMIADPADLLVPYDASAMRYTPVSTRVNSVKNDDAACIEPLVGASESPAEVEEAVEAEDAGEPAAPKQSALF